MALAGAGNFLDGVRATSHLLHRLLVQGIQWIYENMLVPEAILDLELKAPYAVFFNINLIHGCYNNTSDRTRFSLAWEYIESSNKNVASSPDKWCDRNLVG